VTLDAQRQQSGADLLRMTDDFGFGALGAAWIHDEEASRWWYLLVSPMIDSKGPRWVYERLVQIFRKLALPPGITPLDIRIASPHEQSWQIIASTVHVEDSAVFPLKLVINGIQIDKIFAYRVRPADNRAGERTRVFESRYRQLMAAA